MLFRLFCIGWLLLPVWSIAAQEETSEEQLPIIDYYHSNLGFNIPVIGEWEDLSTRDFAYFFKESASAELHVDVVQETEATTGINETLEVVLEFELTDEPLFSDSINLADGTWQQLIYQQDERTVSALGQVRNDKTYVISLTEDQPDADLYMMIVRNMEASTQVSPPDPAPAMVTALAALWEDFDEEPESSELVELPSGVWTQQNYQWDDQPLTVLGMVFGNATYVTIATGDAAAVTDLTNAFNTAFLGFFVTPENNEFLYLGLVGTAIVFLLLIGSLWLRYRNAQKDMQLIEQLQAES